MVDTPKRLYQVTCLYCDAVCGHVTREQLMRKKHSRPGFWRKCLQCGKWFAQGGAKAWVYGRVQVEQRVARLGLPARVAETVIAMAACDVLMGLAYGHNVELRVTEAWRESSTTNRGVLEFHENAICNSVRAGDDAAGAG